MRGIDGSTIGFLAGCVIVGLTAVVVTMISGGGPAPGWPHEWDALIVGVLAIVGVFFTVKRIGDQIAQAERHHRDDIERQSVAARAVLPITLSAICKYARACIDQMLPSLEDSREQLRDRAFDFPSLPLEALSVVRDSVRFADVTCH